MSPEEHRAAHDDLLNYALKLDPHAHVKLSIEDEYAFVTVSCKRDIHLMHTELYLHALRHSKLAELMGRSMDMELHLQVVRG